MNTILWTIVLLCLLIQFTLLHTRSRETTASSDARQLLFAPPLTATVTSGARRRNHQPPLHVVFSENHRETDGTGDIKAGVATPTTLLRRTGSFISTTTTRNDAKSLSDQQDVTTNKTILLTRDDIPKRIFTISFQSNESDDNGETQIHKNLQKATDRYRRAWGTGDLTINILTDADCERLVQGAEPRLLTYFQSLQLHTDKEYLCRIAGLYLMGGYFVDVAASDSNTTTIPQYPWINNDSANHSCPFLAVGRSDQFGPSISLQAVTPQHVIIKQALEILAQQGSRPFTVSANDKSVRHSPEQALYMAYRKLGYHEDDAMSHCVLEQADQVVDSVRHR